MDLQQAYCGNYLYFEVRQRIGQCVNMWNTHFGHRPMDSVEENLIDHITVRLRDLECWRTEILVPAARTKPGTGVEPLRQRNSCSSTYSLY